jgi:CTP:molybdopterin cytidylyltransferase MocA
MANVSDIRLIVGYNADALIPIASDLHVRVVENPRYEQGMFSSVVTGLQTLEESVQGVFVQPVDIPLVRPETIRRLRAAFEESADRILFPVFRGRRGHPPLIPRPHVPDILTWRGENGLKGAFSQLQGHTLDVAVADEGILKDVDTPEAYRQIRVRFSHCDIPTLDECHAILGLSDPLPQEVKRHCEAVARMALMLTRKLNCSGFRLNEDLVLASALLHDVARGSPHHARVGSDSLREMGFDRVADIVAVHMDLTRQETAIIDEASVVFLADKLIYQDRPVSLMERFRLKRDRYAQDPEVNELVCRRKEQAIEIKHAIEAVVGVTLEEVPDSESNCWPNGMKERDGVTAAR